MALPQAPAGSTMRQLHRSGYRWAVTAALCSHGDIGMSLFRLCKHNMPAVDDDGRLDGDPVSYGYASDAADVVAVVGPVLRRFVDQHGGRLSRCGTNIVDAPDQLSRQFAAEITRLIGDGDIPPLRRSVVMPDGRVMQVEELQ